MRPGHPVHAPGTRAPLDPANVHAPSWFAANGIRVFPVHPKTKIPAVKSWDDHVATATEVARYTDYAVCLGTLGVADSDSPESEAWAQAHLPETPFVVKTARGLHRYYRLRDPERTPNFFHRSGMSIEFRNRGQYVIGPGSTHATGAIYTALAWSWRLEDIPIFDVDNFLWDDRPVGERGSSAIGGGETYVVPTVIRAGERHDQLFRMCRSMRMRGVPLDAALTACLIENQHHCEPPLSRRSVESHLRRVYNHAMKAGMYVRPTDPAIIASNLEEAGFSPDACRVAALGVNPNWDPDNPEREAEPGEKIVALEMDMYGRTAQEAGMEREGWVSSLDNGQWKMKRVKGGESC